MIIYKNKTYLNKFTYKIIGAAMEVHKNMGPGLLEKVYEECLCHELDLKGINYERQKNIPLIYKEKELNFNYRADLIVENKIIIELKTVDYILPIHEAQLLTYLKMTELSLGLLINFKVFKLIDGITRIVRG